MLVNIRFVQPQVCGDNVPPDTALCRIKISTVSKDNMDMASLEMDAVARLLLDEVYEVECSEKGIVCLNANQTDDLCKDYEVSYVCDGQCHWFTYNFIHHIHVMNKAVTVLAFRRRSEAYHEPTPIKGP